MREFLQQLRKRATVGLICGSMLNKLMENLGATVTSDFDYVFTENGLVAFHNGQEIGRNDIRTRYTNEQLNELIAWVLR